MNLWIKKHLFKGVFLSNLPSQKKQQLITCHINLSLNKCKKCTYSFIFHAYVCTFVNLFDILCVLNDYEKLIAR